MKKLLLAAISFAVALILSAPCIVKAADRENEVKFLIGNIRPLTKLGIQGLFTVDGSEDYLASPGLAVGVRLLSEVTPNVSIGGEIQSLMAGTHSSNVLIKNTNSTSSFNSIVFLGEIKIASQKKTTIRPFGLLGLGGHSTAMKVDATPQRGLVWSDTFTRETRSIIDSRQTGFAMTIQAGLDIPANESISFGLTGAWYYLGETTYDSTAVARQMSSIFPGVKSRISALAFLGNIAYRF